MCKKKGCKYCDYWYIEIMMQKTVPEDMRLVQPV